jgi:hypothetical protein
VIDVADPEPANRHRDDADQQQSDQWRHHRSFNLDNDKILTTKAKRRI